MKYWPQIRLQHAFSFRNICSVWWSYLQASQHKRLVHLNGAKLYRVLISTCLSSVLGARAWGMREEQVGSFLSLFGVGQMRKGWRAGSQQNLKERRSCLPASSFLGPCAAIPLHIPPNHPRPHLAPQPETLATLMTSLKREQNLSSFRGGISFQNSCLGLGKGAGSVK